MSKKTTNILYWTFTILFCVLMALTAIPDVLKAPDAVEFMTKLGYPLYFIAFIGWAKILGAIALLIPGYPRIKEWAYAGMAFDLIGAVYSILASGPVDAGMLFMVLPFALLISSYIFYHQKLKFALK